MGTPLLKHGDKIKLPTKLQAGEDVIYDKGPQQPMEAKNGGQGKNHGQLLLVEPDLAAFIAPFSYKINEKLNGRGFATIDMSTVKLAKKQKLNNQVMVLIDGTFKVKLSKGPPALAPPPTNMPDPVLLAMGDAEFIQTLASKVNGE
ncbi:MAG: hypothetical protein AAFO69_02715 [Bacteroidota bacterium]